MSEPAAEQRDQLRARTFFALCGMIFTAALAVRLVHLYQIRDIPLFYHLIGDAEGYDRWAQRIALGEWLGRDVFYQAPLYPYFLAALYKLIGHSLLGVRVVQSVLGAGACVLLAMAGREFFSRRVGLLAGALLAVYPAAIFFDGIIQKSVLDLVLVCLLLYLIGASQNRATTRRWLGTGATLGALMLTRENAGVLVVVVLGWIAFGPALSNRIARFKAAGLLAAALAGVVLPVAVRNAVVGGEFHITTSQLGPNLYIGNNPRADGAYVPLVYGHGSPQQERADATALAEQAVGRTLSPGEVSQFWIDRVKRFIHDQPDAWLRLMRVKFILFWNSTELGDTEDQYAYADWSAPLRGTNRFLSFGVLCAAATIGAGLTWNRWRRLWVLYAIVLAYAASVIAFYVMARYRYPVVPPLMLFAAAGAASLWDAARGKRRDAPEGWLVILCLIAGLTVWAMTRPIRNDMVRASTYQNIGRVLDDQGKLDEAFAYYAKARDLWPADPLVNILMGSIRLDQKRPAEALPYFVEAVRLAPDDAPAHVAYGAGLLAAGQNDAAAAEFQRALQLDPQNPRAREGLRQAGSRPNSTDNPLGL